MQDQEYSTLNLGEASALFSLNFDLIRFDPTGRTGQRLFVFSKVSGDSEYPTAEKVIADYHRKRLAVDAYTFFIAISEIKNRLHDNLNSQS